jgi:hypothetical protein
MRSFRYSTDRAQILDDVTAGVLGEDIAVLVAPDGSSHSRSFASFDEIVDGPGDTAPGNDGFRGASGVYRVCPRRLPIGTHRSARREA